MSKIVTASFCQHPITNNPDVCAERRLLNKYMNEARAHGVPNHKLIPWIHRKTGGLITVTRQRADGSYGCSVPCLLCRAMCIRLKMRVRCFTETGEWFEGCLDDVNAPNSKPTSGQRRTHFLGRPTFLTDSSPRSLAPKEM